MSLIRSPAGRLVVSLAIGAAVILAITHGLKAAGLRPGAGTLTAITVAWVVVGCWFVFNYWRGIDEAAREAQKWAWYWGGTLSLGLSVIAIRFPSFRVVDLLPADASRHDLVFYGAAIVMAAQLVGFGVAWAFWWWKRR